MKIKKGDKRTSWDIIRLVNKEEYWGPTTSKNLYKSIRMVDLEGVQLLFYRV